MHRGRARTVQAEPATPAGLLLAAGRGTRFDVSGALDKLLAEFDGVPLAIASARRLRAACGRCLAVVRPGSDRLMALLRDEGIETVACADAHLGMGHSLACAARNLLERGDGAAALVALADMPRIAPATYQAVLARLHTPDDIVVPRHQGRRGHPVLFGAHHLGALAALTGDRGASTLLQTRPVTWVDVDDVGILLDVDRPSDLPGASGR